MTPRIRDILRSVRNLIGHKHVVEDDAKVTAYLNDLNHGPTGPWVAAEGFHIWLGFDFGKNGQNNTIKAGEGIVVKVFFNNQTGETKAVLAQAMVQDE